MALVGVACAFVFAYREKLAWTKDLKTSRAETEALRQQLAASAAAQAQAQTSIASIAYRHPSAA